MPLSDTQRKRIETEARNRGVDPAKAIAAAERLSGGSDDKPPLDGETNPTGRPIAERLLIGFLPFIKVHELRSLWLGLDERIPDDELTCGEYQMKHGAPPTSTAAPGDEP